MPKDNLPTPSQQPTEAQVIQPDPVDAEKSDDALITEASREASEADHTVA